MLTCSLGRTLDMIHKPPVRTPPVMKPPEQTGENGFSANTYRKSVLLLQKSPETSGSLRQNVI